MALVLMVTVIFLLQQQKCKNLKVFFKFSALCIEQRYGASKTDMLRTLTFQI
jgi:hypothetical protein